MNTVINIVHPYTFKLRREKKGNVYILGKMGEHAERERKIGEFLHAALRREALIVHYRLNTPQSLRGILADMPFRYDENYQPLCGKQVAQVVTTDRGALRCNGKPKEISMKHWRIIESMITPVAELQRIVGIPDISFFIGGLLERCLTNVMSLYAAECRRNGHRMVYVRDLCVTWSRAELRRIEPLLHQKGIEPIDSLEAMTLLRGEARSV